MAVFLERFVLASLAAGFIAVLLTNPMNFDAVQRSTLAIACLALAVFAAHTINKTRTAQSTEQRTSTNPPAVVMPSVPQQSGDAIQKKTNSSRGLTVVSIMNEIHAAPPYQKDAIANNFKGIYVEWKGTIWDIEPPLFSKPEDTDVVVKVQPGESLHQILFTASTDKYPRLKILKRGDQVGVSGTIKKCSGPGLYVELDVSEITFPQ